jgi:hypothetical protein
MRTPSDRAEQTGNKGHGQYAGQHPMAAGRSKMRYEVSVEPTGAERRQHRRHDMDRQGINVERWDGKRRLGQPFGQIVDISAGGVRIRTPQPGVRADQQIRLRIELPPYAGIHPFVESAEGSLSGKREWVGWMAISRVKQTEDGDVEVAGRLVDMDEMDRGMLGLYLSTQPLAA